MTRKAQQSVSENDDLRRALAFRIAQGKLSVLAAVTGVSEESIERFVKTGGITETEQVMLRIHQ